MKKKIVGVLMLSLILGSTFLTGCKEKKTENQSNAKTEGKEETSEEGEPLKIRLADQSPSFSLLFSYAKDTGILAEEFKDEDVDIQVTDFATGPVLNEAFAAGEVDVGTIGAMPIISGYKNGYQYHIIGKTNYSYHSLPLVAVEGSGIKTLEDLKGKKIGTAVGGQYHYLLLKYLEQAGLTEDDVEIINSTDDTVNLIHAKEVDAAAWSIVPVQELIDEGAAYLVSDDPKDMIAGFIVADDTFTSEHPEETTKLLKAMDRTIEKIKSNPEEYIAFVADKTQKDEKLIKVFFDTQNFETAITDNDKQGVQNVIDFMVTQGLIEENAVSVDEIFDLQYLD